MDKQLLESANSLMGYTVYEQRKLEKLAEEFDATKFTKKGEKEVDECDDTKKDEVEEGLEDLVAMTSDEDGEGEGEDGEEEVEMISVEDAIRAIELVASGEAETAEEAIEMVKAENGSEGDEEGLEAGEGEEDDAEVDEKFVVAKPKIAPNEIVEGDDCEEEEEEEEKEEKEEKKENYGESHSLFLKLSERYL